MARAIVQIVDECDVEQLVEKCSDGIKEYIKGLVDVNFVEDISVVVRIVDLSGNKLGISDKEENLADTSRGRKRYKIRLDRQVLEAYAKDDIYAMHLSLYHEVAHILDAENYLNSKYAKINPFCKHQKSYENYVAWTGWHFWTEFYAYSMSYGKFGEWEPMQKFSDLYKAWMLLEERYPIVQEKICNQTEDMREWAETFIDDIKALIYSFAKYLGGFVVGKRTYHRAPKNPKAKTAYNRFIKIGNGLCSRLEKLDTNTYGKGMHKKLLSLGDYIIMKFMVPFSIYPIFNDGKISLIMYGD